MIGHLLNGTLTVHRAVYVGDGAGGRTRTFTQVGTIRAKVGQPTAQERTAAAQLGADLTHVVHTYATALVERGDELDVDGPGEARRLRVRSIVGDSHGTYKRLDCEVAQSE